MKRKILLIILCVFSFMAIFYVLISREPTVNSFVTSADSVGYDANLTITMNTWTISDEEKTKDFLIERIIKNDFKNMQFPYDSMGYPRKLKVTVYANDYTKRKGIPTIQFDYFFVLENIRNKN